MPISKSTVYSSPRAVWQVFPAVSVSVVVVVLGVEYTMSVGRKKRGVLFVFSLALFRRRFFIKMLSP